MSAQIKSDVRSDIIFYLRSVSCVLRELVLSMIKERFIFPELVQTSRGEVPPSESRRPPRFSLDNTNHALKKQVRPLVAMPVGDH